MYVFAMREETHTDLRTEAQNRLLSVRPLLSWERLQKKRFMPKSMWPSR